MTPTYTIIIPHKDIHLMEKRRIDYLDTARAVAMLWIVGFWHLRSYTSIGHTNDIVSFRGDGRITEIMLSVFMFLSGFFMAKYSFHDFWNDSKTFYRRRFTRFYVLYAMSALCLYGIGYIQSISSLVTTLTLTSTIIKPQPLTLWFFSMLADFYLLTPFLLRKTHRHFIISCTTVILLGVVLHRFLPNGIDSRFFWCFPSYCIGIWFGKKIHLMEWLTTGFTGVVCLVISVIFLYGDFSIRYAILPFGVTSVLWVSYHITKLPFQSLVRSVAYSSMCAYLFHREIFYALRRICIIMRFDYSYWFCLCIFLPICILLSYYLQRLYDAFSNRYIAHSSK